MDVELPCTATKEALERHKENAAVSALWAINMYLEPVNVMYSVLYWLSQYVNYKLPESEWFNDYITGLMTQPVRFGLSSSQGIAHIHGRFPKYTLLMHVAGTNLHKLPSEHFVQNDCLEILECLCYFLEPANHCFLTHNTFGLKGELELGTFQYNRILSYFYEPSFLIISSYLVYVHYLVTLPNGRELCHFLPRIKNAMKPIHASRLVWDTLQSLNCANSNYESKRRVFEQDLIALYQALDHLEVERVMKEVTALWSAKATYVSEEIRVRYDTIYAQLYDTT